MQLAFSNVLLITHIDFARCLWHRAHALIEYLEVIGTRLTVLYPIFDSARRGDGIRTQSSGMVTYVGCPTSFHAMFNQDTPWCNEFLLQQQTSYDLCITQSPWAGAIGCLMREKGKIGKLIYEDIDYFPGFFADTAVIQAAAYLEAQCLKNADLIVSVSVGLAELRNRQVEKEIICIPNGVKYQDFAAEAASSITGVPSLLYSGSLGEWAGLDMVMECLPRILRKVPELKLVIIGVGEYEDELHRLVLRKRLQKHVMMHNFTPHHLLPGIFRQSSIGIIPFRPCPLTNYSSPLKLFEYTAAGLPVVGTRIGEIERLTNHGNFGVLTEFNVDSFKDSIANLLADPQLCLSYSKNGQNWARAYDWQALFNQEFAAITY